jgi:multidrug efflux pump subunit AcrA (membrane-fusion protein)
MEPHNNASNPIKFHFRFVNCCLLLALVVLLAACSAQAKEQALFYCPMHPQVTAGKASDCQICGMHLVQSKPSPVQAAAAAFVCPMHPQVMSDKPADCTVCGMHLVLQKAVPQPAAPDRFSCPMHPEITSDGPADCASCGMHLVKEAAPDALAGREPIELSTEARNHLSLTLGPVGKRLLSREMRASGRIVPDETRVHRIIARVEGFVDELSVQYAGQQVKKNQPLLGIYSLNIVVAQQQFLNVKPTDGRRFIQTSPKPPAPADGPEKGEDTLRQRLKYWDFSDEQIDRIEKSGKTENSLVLVAPASGFITQKTAIVGLKVFPGDPLMVITDLSTVWAEAEVSEMDVPFVKVGMPMEVRLASVPDKMFRGRVKHFNPLLDPQTHTMKVYLEIPNPGLVLKPDMLCTASLSLDLGEKLTVPEGAVMRSGERDYVFVGDTGSRLVPHSVVLGTRSDGFYEVISGLKEGDRVATSATFLLDSESSLKSALRAAGGKA